MSDQKETLQERLRKEMPTKVVGRMPLSGCREVDWDWQKIEAERKEAASALDAAEARIQVLEKALEPFAKLAVEIEQCAATSDIPIHCWSRSCAWDDLARARTALQGLQSND